MPPPTSSPTTDSEQQRVRRIVLASNNSGKLREMNALLAGHQFQIVGQSSLAVAEVEETGLSFVENALLKARNAAKSTGLAAIADDSGLEVDALGGAPGIHSARYAGPGASSRDNIDKLLRELRSVPDNDRSARFQCVLVMLRSASDPTPVIAQGTWEGTIADAPRGGYGFGYDPVFWIPGEHRTAAELPAAVKNRISHRSQALTTLLRLLERSRR